MSGTPTPRPHAPEDLFRLYLDESGDHVFNRLEEPAHRYLCLVGCWFKGLHYKPFHGALEDLKQRHFPHHPDEPPVLHREDLINRRGSLLASSRPGARRGL